jgi:hypothetical protein
MIVGMRTLKRLSVILSILTCFALLTTHYNTDFFVPIIQRPLQFKYCTPLSYSKFSISKGSADRVVEAIERNAAGVFKRALDKEPYLDKVSFIYSRKAYCALLATRHAIRKKMASFLDTQNLTLFLLVTSRYCHSLQGHSQFRSYVKSFFQGIAARIRSTRLCISSWFTNRFRH